MSRSYRKPYSSWVGLKGCKAQQKWKKQSNSKIRNKEFDFSSPALYKKINDIWNAPSDGHGSYLPECPKLRRK